MHVIAGPDTDAHAFQPRPSDAEAIRGAALVVRNGLGFEPWLDRMLRAAGYAGPVVTATDGITPRSQGATGTPDPHAWQDVRLAQAYLRRIAAGLAAIDPAAATAVAAQEARLGALDSWIRDQLAGVPADRRVLLTSHAAFGYFAAAYGVEALSVQGATEDTQPSAAQMAALIRRIRAARISAVFRDGPGRQAALERLAADAGVAVRGRLYADTLSAPDGPAPGYEAMTRGNVALMVAAMRGS